MLSTQEPDEGAEEGAGEGAGEGAVVSSQGLTSSAKRRLFRR